MEKRRVGNWKLVFGFLLVSIITSACSTFAQEQTGFTSVDKIEKESWFKEEYTNYSPDKKALKVPENVDFLVFGGAWCPDTRRMLPEFYHILDDNGIDRQKAVLYLIDHDFTSDQQLEKAYQINSVPTFVILKNKREVARITNPQPGRLKEEIRRKLEVIS